MNVAKKPAESRVSTSRSCVWLMSTTRGVLCHAPPPSRPRPPRRSRRRHHRLSLQPLVQLTALSPLAAFPGVPGCARAASSTAAPSTAACPPRSRPPGPRAAAPARTPLQRTGAALYSSLVTWTRRVWSFVNMKRKARDEKEQGDWPRQR